MPTCNATNAVSSGIQCYDGNGNFSGRTLSVVGGTITNADGIAGNPTITIPNITNQGAFLPTIKGATSPGSQVYTTQMGTWYKIGKLVYVLVNVATTSNTGTGSAVIQMPFTSVNNGLSNVTIGYYSTLLGLNIGAGFSIAPNSNLCTITAIGTGLVGAITGIANCQFQIFYEYQ